MSPTPNLIFFDTEFTSLDVDARLISIGLITETGDEFYSELTDTFDISICSDFVVETVLPLLEQGPHRMTFRELAVKLKDWIESFEQEVVLISDAPVIDWPFIYDLFQAHGWPTNLRKQGEPIFFWIPDGEKFHQAMEDYWSTHSARQHHALVDARGLYHAWNTITTPTSGLREYVIGLAQHHGVVYVKTSSDKLAEVITRLSDDEVVMDDVQCLLLALHRAGVVNKKQMGQLLVNYLREKQPL